MRPAEGTSYHQKSAYGSPLLPTHNQHVHTYKDRQTPTEPL